MKVIIATWRMALEGIEKAIKNGSNDPLKDIITVITDVEDNKNYHSVGYGGLPNRDGIVELDAAIMSGKTLKIGAVGGIRDIKNPILVAKSLMHSENCNFLVGDGAKDYAKSMGFKCSNLLTKKAKEKYDNEVHLKKDLKAYRTHDTVGVVSFNNGDMAVGTSTSGLFLKKSGRIGDSPLPGSGFYCDNNFGGAVATGMGEVIYRGIISYEIVKLMKNGLSPSEACKKAVCDHLENLKQKGEKIDDISVVAINNKGQYGIYTSIEHFSFVVIEKNKAVVYIAKNKDGELEIKKATPKWIATHTE